MPKNTPKPVIISFRIKPTQLIHALDGLKQQNPHGEYDKLSKIGKAIFLIGLHELMKETVPRKISFDMVDVLNGMTTKTDFKKIIAEMEN